MREHDKLIIKANKTDQYKVVTSRIPVDMLERIDNIANQTKLSRNQIVLRLLMYGLDHLEIQE